MSFCMSTKKEDVSPSSTVAVFSGWFLRSDSHVWNRSSVPRDFLSLVPWSEPLLWQMTAVVPLGEASWNLQTKERLVKLWSDAVRERCCWPRKDGWMKLFDGLNRLLVVNLIPPVGQIIITIIIFLLLLQIQYVMNYPILWSYCQCERYHCPEIPSLVLNK